MIKSIQTKIALWAGLCLFLATVIIIGYATFSLRNIAIEMAKKNIIAVSEYQAGVIKAQLEVAIDTARTNAQTLSAIKNKENPLILSREQISIMMRQILIKNPQFNGVYTVWEPNAFDGQDEKYVNTKGHDQTGRFMAYWNRGSKGEINTEVVIEYDVEGNGDYYLCPKKTKQECITSPYVYPVQGKDVLMTSLVVPIIYEGQFYGIAGVDMSLDFMQELADKIDIYDKSGVLVLLSNNGTLAGVTGQSALAGTPMTTYSADLMQLRESVAKFKISH